MRTRNRLVLAAGALVLGAATWLASRRPARPSGAWEAGAGAPAAEAPDTPPAEADASGGARVETPGREPFVLRVVDETTGAPVAGAHVTIRLERRREEQYDSDRGGFVRLGGGGPCSVAVRAAGYSPRQVWTTLAESRPLVVALAAGATLTVHLTDPSGRSCEGVEASLLPALVAQGPAPGSWGMELRMRIAAAESAARRTDGEHEGGLASALHLVRWNTRADAEGTLRWSELPAGLYRWASSPLVTPQPALEKSEGPFPVRGVSGTFELATGGAARFEGTVQHAAAVRGRVVGTDPTLPARVRLLECVPAGDAPYPYRRDEEAGAAEPDGSFRITGVLPGEKLLRAVWREADGFHFTTVVFSLASGEDRDLGELRALAGDDVEASVLWAARGGTTAIDDPELLAALPKAVLLSVSVVPDSARLEERLTEVVEVPVPSTTRLCGLPSGRLVLAARPQATFHPDPGFTVDWPREVGFDFGAPRDASVSLPFAVHRNRALDIAGLAPFPTSKVVVRLLSIADGRVSDAEIHPDAWPRQRVDLPGDGRHILLAYTPSYYGRENLVAQAELDASAGGIPEVVLDLHPGCIVEGRAHVPSGEPLAKETLCVTFPPWDARPCLYFADTDADGRFRLQGLVPRTTYRVQGGNGFTTGAPGSRATVDLEVEPW